MDKRKLDLLAGELRCAVLAVDHARADRVAREYAEALSEFWETLPASEQAVSPLPGLAHELLGWARGMTIVQRAIAAEQLASIQGTKRYHEERPRRARASSIQVHA
jgi:hypothetical protein